MHQAMKVLLIIEYNYIINLNPHTCSLLRTVSLISFFPAFHVFTASPNGILVKIKIQLKIASISFRFYNFFPFSLARVLRGENRGDCWDFPRIKVGSLVSTIFAFSSSRMKTINVRHNYSRHSAIVSNIPLFNPPTGESRIV